MSTKTRTSPNNNLLTAAKALAACLSTCKA